MLEQPSSLLVVVCLVPLSAVAQVRLLVRPPLVLPAAPWSLRPQPTLGILAPSSCPTMHLTRKRLGPSLEGLALHPNHRPSLHSFAQIHQKYMADKSQE